MMSLAISSVIGVILGHLLAITVISTEVYRHKQSVRKND